MKKVNLILVCAAVAAAAVSCQKDNELRPDAGRTLRVEAAAEGTRTAIDDFWKMSWSVGDHIGISVANASAPTVNADAHTESAGSSAVFEVAVGDCAAGDMVYAYYPYAADATDDGANVTLTVPSVQNMAADGEWDGASAPMVAAAAVTGDASVQLTFLHTAALVELNIYAGEEQYAADGVVYKATFTADGGANAAGSFTVDLSSLSGGTLPEIGAVTDGSAAVTVVAVDGAAVSADKEGCVLRFSMLPATCSGTLDVFTSFGDFTYEIPSREFARAGVARYNVPLRAANLASSNLLRGGAFNEGDEQYWTVVNADEGAGKDLGVRPNQASIRDGEVNFALTERLYHAFYQKVEITDSDLGTYAIYVNFRNYSSFNGGGRFYVGFSTIEPQDGVAYYSKLSSTPFFAKTEMAISDTHDESFFKIGTPWCGSGTTLEKENERITFTVEEPGDYYFVLGVEIWTAPFDGAFDDAVLEKLD